MENRVTFLTAQVANYKGFNIPASRFYDKYGMLSPSIKQYYEDNGNYDLFPGECNFNDDEYIELYLAPTQSVLKKWLMDVHKIDIEIKKSVVEGMYYSVISKDSQSLNICNNSNSSFEDSLEDALYESLKKI